MFPSVICVCVCEDFKIIPFLVLRVHVLVDREFLIFEIKLHVLQVDWIRIVSDDLEGIPVHGSLSSRAIEWFAIKALRVEAEE